MHFTVQRVEQDAMSKKFPVQSEFVS